MVKRLLLTALSVAALPAQSKQYYEEEPVASMAIREKLWRQMGEYAKSLANGDSVEPMRELLKRRIGYPPPGFVDRASMRIERIGEDSIATYHRTYLEVAPGMDAYGLYLVPKNAKFPAPLVISQHGGGGTPEMALFKGGSNYHDMVRGAAERGYVVYAPHTLMYPYRDRDKGTAIPAEARAEIDAALRGRGTSLAAVEIGKIAKALDVLLERPEIDRRRVAMVGLSYGGFYTSYVAALEPRIRVAVASCSFRDMPEEGIKVMEGRLYDLSPLQTALLIAPRALQIQSGIRDKGFPIGEVRALIPHVERRFEALGARDRFEFQAFDGGHEWRGDVAWAFLGKHLK